MWSTKIQNATRVEWFSFWFIINCVVGYMIGQQKSDVGTAIVLSILLGPIGWLIAALSSGNLRKCPHCAEHVKPEAKVCRHCGKDLPPIQKTPLVPVRDDPGEQLRPPTPLTKSDKIFLGSILVVVVAVIIGAMVSSTRPGKQPQSKEVRQDARAPAETPQETYFSLKLTKPVELKDSLGRVIARLQQGQSVQYVGRGTYFVRIRYDGADYDIRISSTDLK